ncbi:hypothetical protein DYBT9275_03374 [Dyadobacter sp. CECT 9275]|uniref:Uncharacterized protein n=1 Tax=Dyadobacter helix TaxID=2822344 RepID=A0A916JDC0_9BACT|nr:hypothetical protein [Dyadobacter sp. CECT 9275]CAG5004457.1 hypothetical protein DYBT9275_03374 [Dyadobacter sp. CECT 9275]
MNIIYTVCNRSSLPHALALGASVMEHQPGDIFYIGWVDNRPVPHLPEQYRIIPVTDLAIPLWQQMTEQYYDFELLPACRPWFAKKIMELNPHCNRLTFFAPTVLLLNSVESVIGRQAEMTLTPHITSPLRKSAPLEDKRILNIGMFHAGSWSIRKSTQTLDFLNWWAVRTLDRAKYDLCDGMCLDQLWLNFGPVRIHNWEKVSEPSWHYGLHRLPNHPLEAANGQFSVGGNTLLSVDFAGLLFFDPIWSDYAGMARRSIAFQELVSYYRTLLAAAGPEATPKGTPGYGQIPEIKAGRILRNKLAAKLSDITEFIDQYQI